SDAGARWHARHREDEPLRNRGARRRSATRADPGEAEGRARGQGRQRHARRAGRAVARRRLPGRGGKDGVIRKALAVGIKEFRQIRRDRRTLMILLFIPVFFLLLYGYALNFDIKHVRLAVEDRDYTPERRRLISAFVNSAYFDQVASVTTDREVSDLMDRDQSRAALVIPHGFGPELQRGRAESGG